MSYKNYCVVIFPGKAKLFTLTILFTESPLQVEYMYHVVHHLAFVMNIYNIVELEKHMLLIDFQSVLLL